MKLIKISSDLIEKSLITGEILPACKIIEGIEKDDKLIDIKFDKYQGILELWFDKETFPEPKNIVIKRIK